MFFDKLWAMSRFILLWNTYVWLEISNQELALVSKVKTLVKSEI